MAWVVFLRGVNVGGHQSFQPKALAAELADWDVVSVGAAGSFVVRKTIAQAALRAEFLRRLPFQPELMICRGRDLIDLASGEAFPEPVDEGARRFVSVMAKRPQVLPPLPCCQPAGDQWQVQIVKVVGPFALSLHRRVGPRLIYPNEVVEKKLGVPATTRNLNTVEAVCEVLKRGA